jgi:hypothetical protein
MTWAYVLRPREMAAYRRCRRAWDLGARIRQDYVPALPERVFDFDRALHDGLAVYYFPAMDDWDRAIVRPLAVKGFLRAMREDLAHYEAVAELTEEQGRAWDEACALGESMLEGYFAWAGPLDTFASIFSDQEYWAPVPDPANPGSDLASAQGHEIRYLGRVDQLFSDHNDEYWIADHRIVGNRWGDDHQLLLDLDGVTDIWATEMTYPQLRIAGTVYNELRIDINPAGNPDDAADERFDAARSDPPWMDADGRTMWEARHVHTRRSPLSPEIPEGDLVETDPLEVLMMGGDDPASAGAPDPRADRIVRRETGEWFRRTYIRRSRASIRAVGLKVAAEAAEVADPSLPVYPNPSPATCAACSFRAPCLAMNEGTDPGPVLAAAYRRRTPEEGEEERLRWSIGRAQTRASTSGKDSRPDTVNFHWG